MRLQVMATCHGQLRRLPGPLRAERHKPVIAYAFLQACASSRRHVELRRALRAGHRAQRERIAMLLHGSLMVVTALAPHIGYDKRRRSRRRRTARAGASRSRGRPRIRRRGAVRRWVRPEKRSALLTRSSAAVGRSSGGGSLSGGRDSDRRRLRNVGVAGGRWGNPGLRRFRRRDMRDFFIMSPVCLRFMAAVRVCGLRRNAFQGSERAPRRRRRRCPRGMTWLHAPPSSSQCNGVETGAPLRARTE